MNNIPNSQKWIQCIYVRNMSSHQDDKNKESLVDHREISNEASQTLDNMIIFFLSFDVLHIDLSRFPRPETGLYNSPFMGMKPLELDVHILFGNKDMYMYGEALQLRNNQSNGRKLSFYSYNSYYSQ